MAEYEKYLNWAYPLNPIVRLAKEIFELRRMLWLGHGHKGMYGDDGEMQCSQCASEYGFWDWKRTPIDEIEAKITEANMKKLAETREDVMERIEMMELLCDHCSSRQWKYLGRGIYKCLQCGCKVKILLTIN